MAVLGKLAFYKRCYFESVKLNFEKPSYVWEVGYLAADFIRGLRVIGSAESKGVNGISNAVEPILLTASDYTSEWFVSEQTSIMIGCF